MSRAEFFPYPIAEHALQLSYELMTDELAVSETGRIEAEGVPEAASVRMRINLAIDDGTLERVLPAAELPEPPIGAIVAVQSIASRRREAIRLQHHGDGWEGEFDISKSEVFGEVVLEPKVIRTSPGDNPGYAAHVGALLASGGAVTIEIDQPPVPPGGYLDIRFDSFRESSSPKRSRHPDLLYMLDTDREVPILWLNEGVPGFKPVMLAKGPRGGNLRVRDAMFDTIVSQAWTSLAAIAFTQLAVMTQRLQAAHDDSDPLEALPEWEQRVISFWAPHLQPGTRAEAIEWVVETASNATTLPELFDNLSCAVQRQARTEHAFHGLIRLRDREGV
jgi:hypothetical protein